jgi:hypothetical protein
MCLNNIICLHMFRMRRHVFVCLLNTVEEHNDYFIQKRNAAGMLGLSCLQKVATAFRMIANGVAVAATDEYMRVGKSTAMKCLRKFVVTIVKVFGPEYLRLTNEHDTAMLLAIDESRGFSGMFGSIDCMHWGWKNYPTVRHIMYMGNKKGVYNYIGSSCFKKLMNLACILRDARLAQ